MPRKTGCSSVAPSDGPAPAGSTRTSTTIQDERRQLQTLMNINRGFVKSIDAYALVLVLLATVTYPTFSQPPGSFDDDGLMRTSGNPRLLWFVYLNSFSFFFSMTDLLLCLSGKYAPMSNLRKADLGDPKTQEELAKFNEKLAHSVLFTLTKLLVINVLFVLSLTCCIAAYIAAGSAVQQLTISNRLSIIIPGIGGCLLYSVFVVWLFLDFALFFSFARSGSGSSLDVDCFRDFGTMIWFFLSLGGSSCTQNRFQRLAQKLAETARLWSVRQLFNKASDEINCYDHNIPAPLSATRNNTPNELNAAEQTSQQQQQRSTETSNNAAAAAAAFRAQQSADNNNAAASSSTAFRPLTSPSAVNAVEWQQQQPPAHRRPARIPNSQDVPSFRDQTSVPLSARSRVQELGKFETPDDDDKEAEEEEQEGGGEGHGPEPEADLHGPVANSRTSLGVRCSSFRCSTCYGIPCVCGTGLTQL